MPTSIPTATLTPTQIPGRCGDGLVNQATEQCDGTTGVTAQENFCTQDCKLIPIYNGAATCPANTISTLIGQYTVSATSATGINIPVSSGNTYLFEASGTFRPTSAANWYSDAAYTSNNNWATVSSDYGLVGRGSDYGAHVLAANFNGTLGLINWGEYKADHKYTFVHTVNSTNVNFLINDRYGNWFNTSWNNQTGMRDNQGQLNLNVYHCQPTATVKLCKQNTKGEFLSGWKLALIGDVADTTSVLPDGKTYTTGNLSLGNYVLKAEGAYTYRNDANATLSDAGYSQRAPSDSVYGGEYAPWAAVKNFPAPVTGYLGVMVNGNSATDWGYFSPDHHYFLSLSNYSGPVNYQILDDYYGDNRGSVKVSAYEGFTGLTDNTGCVTFSHVPYGQYAAEELMKKDWSVAPGYTTVKSLNVNSPEITYTFVNKDPIPRGDLQVCKQNALGQKLANWQMNLSTYEMVGEYTLNTNNPAGLITPVLAAGSQYQIEVSGTWTNRGNETRDAFYDALSGKSDPFEGPGVYDPRIIKLVLGNGPTTQAQFMSQWGGYQSSHIYTTVVNGSNTSLNLRLWDHPNDSDSTGWYGDNQGQLTIKIRRILNTQSQVTGDNGCAQFLQNEVGPYLLTETTQPGWNFVSLQNTQGSSIANNVITLTVDGGSYLFTNELLPVVPTPTITVTVTPTVTETPVETVTPTETLTPTLTETPTVTPTVSVTPEVTPTVTPSETPTATPELTPTVTVTPTVTPTLSSTPTATLTPTVTPEGQVAGASTSNPSSNPPASCTAPKADLVANFRIVSQGTNSIDLAWSKVNNASYYGLFFTNLATGVVYGADNIGDTTQYRLNGVSGGAAYRLEIFAVNGCQPGDRTSLTSGVISGPVLDTRPVSQEGQVLGDQTETETTDAVLAGPTTAPDTQVELQSGEVLGDSNTCDRCFVWPILIINLLLAGLLLILSRFASVILMRIVSFVSSALVYVFYVWANWSCISRWWFVFYVNSSNLVCRLFPLIVVLLFAFTWFAMRRQENE